MNTVSFKSAILEVSAKEINLLWLALKYYKETVVPSYNVYNPRKTTDQLLSKMLGKSIEKLNAEAINNMQNEVQQIMDVLVEAEKYYPFIESPSEMTKGAK